MKRLYLIGGTMGVGKTAVCRALQKKLPACVFLDGDWCWDADPFTVNDETKAMVMRSIRFMLNQFLRCTAYQTVVFCWVMHDKAIIDDILGGIDAKDCQITVLSLVCGADTLRARLEKDISAGIREGDIVERSLARLPLYAALDTRKIDTDGKPADSVADEIASLT